MENNMENFEVENQNNEGVEVMEEIMNNEVEAKEAGLGFLAGLGIGAGAGLAVATGTWFYQRKVRRDILKALKYSMEIAALKNKNSKTYTTKKRRKEVTVSIENIDIRGSIKLIAYIQENLSKVRMSKSERKDWESIIDELVTQGGIASNQDMIVEETIDNKNAE